MSNKVALATGKRSRSHTPGLLLPGFVRRVLPVLVVVVALLLVWEGSKLLFGISDNKLPT